MQKYSKVQKETNSRSLIGHCAHMITLMENSKKPPLLPLLSVSQVQVIWFTVMAMEHQMCGDEGTHTTLDEQAQEFIFG